MLVGGSKGIPRKNIRLLAGKPLIAYSIEAALKSRYIDRVIVSTEDEEIAEIAKHCGAEIIIRPKELAKDESPSIERYLRMRRQDLEVVYIPKGAIYVSAPQTLYKYMRFYCNYIIPYIMPIERSVDIDTDMHIKLQALKSIGMKLTNGLRGLKAERMTKLLI